jgi:hypothetical protein
MSKARDDAVVPFTPAADYTSKKGYLVDLASDTATISTSATTVAKGVIVEGNETSAGYATEKVSVAILGAVKGTVYMRLGGSVTKGAFVQQHTDGTVITDAASGARVIVGVALEGGVAGDNIEVAPISPDVHHATES